MATPLRLGWMWGDAGMPLLGFAAVSNPMRWSYGTPAEVAAELEQQESARPVNVCISGESYITTFAGPHDAAEWVRDCAEQPTEGSVMMNLALSTSSFLAAPAMALYCRYYCDLPWKQRNVFAAGMYAHTVCRVPKEVAAAQTRAGSHARVQSSWDHFDTSRARTLTAFVEAASTPPGARPASMEVEHRQWALADGGNFHVIYTSETEAILAFRGGDGGKEDAATHPGSPVRAFMQGEDPSAVPALPLALLRSLEHTLTITVVGYSQGGIAALACALQLGHGLSQCILFNCATMFWPKWLDDLLPVDWWEHAPEVSGKVESWVVRDDPLSEGSPGGHVRAPRTPGTTRILPPCARGRSLLDNHHFAHFVAPLPRVQMDADEEEEAGGAQEGSGSTISFE